MRPPLAWSLAAFSAVCAVADTMITHAFQPLLSEATIAVHGWPLVNVASLGSAVMGALVLSRYPRHPIGWLLNIIGASTSLSVLSESYSIWIVDEGGPGPTWVGDSAGFVAAVTGGVFALTGLAIMFLLAPDGQLLSARWRWMVHAAIGGLVLFDVGLANETPRDIAGRGHPDHVNAVARAFLSAGALITTVAVLASVVAMVVRLRRSTGEQRQQLRWIAAAAGSMAAGLVALVAGEAISGGKQTWGSSLPLQVAFVFLPVSFAIAVLRYRLFDIDVIINRTLVLGLGTLLVACGYIVLVVGVGAALGARAKGFWPSIAATTLVALVFQPLRRGVVRFADRVVYGRRAAPYDALSAFSRRVGDSPAPESLLPAVAEAAAQAVSAHHAVVMLDITSGPAQWATWPVTQAADPPVPAAGAITLPVSDRAGELGRLSVTLPPGRALRAGERRLLQDLAEQAAIAFRNARIEAELTAQVEALHTRADQLAASRRRLIDAGDSERRRLEAAISRDVLPTLKGLHADLEQIRAGGTLDRPPSYFIDCATDALESLRELTRGIFPTMLSRAGLGPALSSYFARLGRADVLHVGESVAGQRFPARVEAAAYYCCTEAVTNASEDVRVSLSFLDSQVELEVYAVNPDAVDRRAMLDRVEAAAGSFELMDTGVMGPAARLRITLPVDARLAGEQVIKAGLRVD